MPHCFPVAMLIVWLLVRGLPRNAPACARRSALSHVVRDLQVPMPGQFESQMNAYHITHSFYIRINDLLTGSTATTLRDTLSPYLVDTHA